MKTNKFKYITLILLGLVLSTPSLSATVDGVISTNEYQWSSDNPNRSTLQGSFYGTTEVEDASGGDSYDITYFGANKTDTKLQFAIAGGDIVSGVPLTGDNIILSDIALSVQGSENYLNPTGSSEGFNYAIRLTSTNSATNSATFDLITGGTWQGSDIYNGAYVNHQTDTFKMTGGSVLTSFTGVWASGSENIFEGEFDLSFLGLITPDDSYLAMYVTMSCVNDESMIYNYQPLPQIPVPATLFLFTPALLGFVGLRRALTK